MAELKFNRLTIVEDLGMKQHGFSARARRMVKCHCDCGTKLVVRRDHVESGHTESCGCLNRERVGAAAKGVNRSKVVVGHPHGGAQVLKRLENTLSGSAAYLCRCHCGVEWPVSGTRLTAPKARLIQCSKCGHANHLAKIHAVRTKPPGEAACTAVFVQTKYSCAKKRGLVWEITLEDWKRLTVLACHYCGAAPSNCSEGGYGRNGSYRYNGLDRVDNGVGYTLENVVPCCKWCNHAKSDSGVVEFLAWACRIALKHNK
jgi:hypothetical protein